MKNNPYKAPEFFGAVVTFLVSTALNAAGIPPINVTLSSGPDTNHVKISKGQLKLVEYKIQDVIGRPPSRTWLWSPTAPAYATRTSSLQQPDCAMYNQPNSNPNSFTLPPNGVCYFAIQIDGTKFANTPLKTSSKAAQATNQSYRPIFTNSDGVAYGPCQSEIIYTTLIAALPIISVGTYNEDDDLTQRPLLALSQDLGGTWSFPESITAPTYTPEDILHTFVGKGIFYGASCSKSICIAVGEGEEHSVTHMNPLLAVTQDAGDSWIYPVAVVAPVLTYQYGQSGNFQAASCYNNTCIAVGDYRDTSHKRRNLLAFSQNSGSSWRFADTISDLVFTLNTNPYLDNASLRSANCNKNMCVTVGYYQDTNGIFRPLLAQSNDSASSWTYPSMFNDPIFYPSTNAHPFQNGGNLKSVSCNQNICIAVGEYNDTNNIARPLLALSQDAGNIWSFPAEITDPVFTPSTANDFANDGSFQGASCYNNTCIAVGYYQDSNGIYRPLLGRTQDSGNTWQFPSSINEPVFAAPNDFVEGDFSSVSCYGTRCIAVGGYLDNNALGRPLLALSQDLGETWTYPSSIISPVFIPSNSNAFSEGYFSSASCNATTCIASGYYYDASGTRRPLLAWSQDSGNTWTYPSSINAPVFTPQNTNPFIKQGAFKSASASTIPFLPDSLKRLNLRSPHHNNQRHIGRSTR